ncbi:MAG TPA: AAA family ATPase [Nocardioidaceae bacterium]|nr:AAA family ATPase [Nocardioidaceae bacterium]
MLLERGSQLQTLSLLVDDARAGRGSVALVEGEAGCGKSTLLRAGTSAMDSWWGYCDPLSTPRPLGPLLDIASQVPGLVLGVDPFEAYDVLLRLARDRVDPVAIVVEDVHWADEATLGMLLHLGRRITDTHAVVAVSFRGDEVSPSLRRMLGDLGRHPHTHRLEVGPLSLGSVLELAGPAGLDAAALHAATAGNPFFVSEIVASGGDVPANVRDAVLARNAALPAAARDTIELVSAEPRGLELEHVPGVDATRGVLAVADGVVRFRHDLARRTTYDSLAPDRRVQLHRRLLGLLAGSRDVARLAHHAVGTRDPALVVAHAWPAAAEALARGAHLEALALYQAVSAQESVLTSEQRTQVLLEVADTLSRLDLQERSTDTARRAVGEAERSGDTLLLGKARFMLARALWRTGASAEAGDVGEQAVVTLRPLGPTSALADALRGAAQAQMLARHHLPALTRVRQAADVAAQVGDEAASIRAELIEGTIELVTGDPDRGVELLLSSLERARRRDDRQIVVESLGMLGSGGGEARLYDRAYRCLTELSAMAQDRNHDYQVAYSTSWQARIRCEQGRFDEALALAEPLTESQGSPISLATALGVVGRVRVRRGDADAMAPLDRVVALTGLELQHRWVSLCALAELHWLAGDLEAGRNAVRDAYAQSLTTDSPWAQGELGYWLWRNEGLDVPPPLAAKPFAAHMRGDWAAAADLWAGIGCPYEQALALLDGDADAVLSGLALLDRLGARPLAVRARRRLADLGVGRAPRRTTLAHPLGLTEREAEVHALLREGLTNAEIADRLVLSTRTVDHHVSAVLRKTGVSSRSELRDGFSSS